MMQRLHPVNYGLHSLSTKETWVTVDPTSAAEGEEPPNVHFGTRSHLRAVLP